MLQVLKDGEVLCIMGDRAMGGDRSTVAVDFLGGAVQFPFTPYMLSSATGAPVAYRPHAEEFVRALEYSWKRPYQYFNFFDMWR